MTNGIKMKRTILFILTVLLIAGCGKNNRGYSELVMSVPETPNTKTHLVPDGVHRLFDDLGLSDTHVLSPNRAVPAAVIETLPDIWT